MHRLHGFTGVRFSLAVLLASLMLPACKREQPAAAVAGASAQVVETDLAVLPNNMAIHVGKHSIAAVRGDGEVAWELVLPDGDTVIAPATAALNSVTYVRGSKALHAALPDGKWAWSKPLEGQASAKTRTINMPVAFSDSTVALVVGDDVIRFTHDGSVRWRVSLPEGHINGHLAAGMDGSLLVPTSAGIYSLSPDGSIAWRKVVGG